MNPKPDVSIEEQRDALRKRMQLQRQVIAEKLGPPPEMDTGYPRSKTMRFLTRRPGLAATVLAELFGLIVGAHHAKAVTAATALSRIVRAASGNGARRPRPGLP